MQTQVLVQNGHPAIPAPVVTATDVVRRYGEGDTAVDALRGVSVDIAARPPDRGHGPVGLRQVDAHAHPRRPRPARPPARSPSPASTSATSTTTQLTKLRRDHIGFIFQFFNLLPMLTAAENIVLPLELAGVKPDQAWLDEVVASVGLTERLVAPPVGALRRPAAARRRRPRARLAARA